MLWLTLAGPPTSAHICGAGGAWSGGECAVRQCLKGLRVRNSSTTCKGGTGSICSLDCDKGYVARGVHVCQVHRASSLVT